MWKAEKARHAMAAKRAELNMAVLLTLVVFCFLPLMCEQDCNGTHAWESIDLAILGTPVWCIAIVYREWSFRNLRLEMWVYGLLLAYELVLVGCHASLLWGQCSGCCWHRILFSEVAQAEGSVWGWLPGHVCLLVLAGYAFAVAWRLGKCRG